MIRKLILANTIALKTKYKPAGWMAISQALTRLAIADGLRGITTTVDFLDAPIVSGVPKVTTKGNQNQVKAAIDAMYAKHSSPDYVLLLGSTDVIPHQHLKNPAKGGPDTDEDVPSDLPYACSAPYSTDIGDFLGPTRVVGRLPDVIGSKDPAGLIALIDAAASFSGTLGKKAFVLSAEVWKSATAANVKLAFGKAQAVSLSPPDGPAWPASTMGAQLHFINCHGAADDELYYGQKGDDYPEAHQPSNLIGTVARGAIAVAECCYGAQQYKPKAHRSDAISMTALLQGAAAFCGSTNIAYGENTAARRCDADILCAEFLRAIVLDKATTGRALLQARQELVKVTGPAAMDPFDLKTLAQFVLLGDPSLRPFAVAAGHAKWLNLPPGVAHLAGISIKALGRAPKSVQPAAHILRRKRMKRTGLGLGEATPFAQRVAVAVPQPILATLNKLLADEGFVPGEAASFEVKGPVAKGTKHAGAKSHPKASSAREETIHVVFSARAQPPGAKAITAAAAVSDAGSPIARENAGPRPGIKDFRAAVARTRGQEVVSYKTVCSR